MSSVALSPQALRDTSENVSTRARMMDRLANLYLVLVIVVDGLPEYLPVRETVATAPLHVIENVGDAIVYVLGRVAVVLRK